MQLSPLITQDVICIRNDGYAASLEPRKVYAVIPDEKAARRGFVRVVDESGEDYLYPANFFAPIELAPATREALHLSSSPDR